MIFPNSSSYHKLFTRKCVPLLLTAAGCAVGVPPARAQKVAATFAPDEVLFALRPRTQFAATGISRKLGGISGYQIALNAYRAAVAPGHTVQDTIAALKQNPDVLYAEPNYTLTALRSKPQPNDSYFSQQYAPQLTQADAAWGIWQPATPVTIAIVDTGVDSTHPDLKNKMLRDSKGAVIGYNALDKSSNALDDHYHGTHCAGIAAAEGNNSLGVAGIAGWDFGATHYVQVMPVKVLDKNGSGYTSGVADGIIWAADHGAKVISLSLGGPDSSDTMSAAIAYAWNKGAIIVAAAGNDGVNTKFYPAGSDHVISVGATDSGDALTSFSNYGDWVKVAAPGLNIFSTLPNGKYGYLSGTSMAGPHVAGEAALLFAQFPTLSNDAVSALILAQTDPIAAGSHALSASAGRINVYKALTAAGATGGSGAPPTPTLQIAFAPATVADGGKTTGTVTLSSAAPKAGTPLTFSGDSKLLTFSGSGLVESGKTTKTFPVYAGYPDANAATQFTVTSGTLSATATLTVQGVHPQTVAPSTKPSAVAGTYTFSVALDHATTNGKPVTVSLASSSPIVTVPASVTVPAGQSAASFSATVGAVNADSKVTLTATANGGNAAVDLMLKSNVANLDGVSFSLPQVTGGAPDTLTVRLSLPAPVGGAVVSLSADGSALTAPATITIPAGKTFATVTLPSLPVAAKTAVTVSAVYKGVTKTASVYVAPPALTGLSFPAGTLASGKSVTGTVTIGSAAPANGLQITLTGSGLSTLPANVAIAAGATSGTFTFTPPTVTKTTLFPVTATLNGATKQATLTVAAGKK